MRQNHDIDRPADGVPVKMWTRGVPVEAEAWQQPADAARLPIAFRRIAVMPDVHLDIDAVMQAQKDLVEVAHALRQGVCVNG